MKKLYRQISRKLKIIILVLPLTLLLPFFLSAMDNKPSFDQSLLMGKELYDSGRYESALKEYLYLSKSYPDNGRLLYETALTYYTLKDYSRALTNAQQASELLPGEDKVKTLLGNIFDNLGRSDDALKEYMAAVKTNPKNYSAYYNLGIFYYNNGRYKDAEEAFLSSVNINDDNPSAYYSLGCVYIKLNAADSAKDSFKRFLDLEKKSDRSDEVRNILKKLIVSKPEK